MRTYQTKCCCVCACISRRGPCADLQELYSIPGVHTLFLPTSVDPTSVLERRRPRNGDKGLPVIDSGGTYELYRYFSTDLGQGCVLRPTESGDLGTKPFENRSGTNAASARQRQERISEPRPVFGLKLLHIGVKDVLFHSPE